MLCLALGTPETMAEYEYNAEEIDAEEDGGERVRACQIGPASHSQLHRSLDSFCQRAHHIITNKHCFPQKYTPTRDNVIFLIDVQQSMFQEAGLKDTEVRVGCPAHSFVSL